MRPKGRWHIRFMRRRFVLKTVLLLSHRRLFFSSISRPHKRMPPKRRFWKAEPAFQSASSNHFSTILSPNRVLTALLSFESEIHMGMPSSCEVDGRHIATWHHLVSSTDTSSWCHLVLSTSTSACHHHLVILTGTSACYHQHAIINMLSSCEFERHMSNLSSTCHYLVSHVGNNISAKYPRRIL